MSRLRLLSIAVAAVFFGTANAIPVHHPTNGEVVHIEPDLTIGGGSVGTGRVLAHPHISMGHLGDGHYALAPVTHGTGDHLKPYMPTPNEHGLRGVTRLDHITGHADHIQASYGPLTGAVLSKSSMNNIRGAQALVQDHRRAGYAHTLAGHAHRLEHDRLEQDSSRHFHNMNVGLGAALATEAKNHANHAEKHEQAAANHYHAANQVNGPHASQRIHAQNSEAHALEVHQHFTEAREHHSKAIEHERKAYGTQNVHQAQQHHNTAQQEHAHAANSRAHGNHASPISITHHNSATGHHL